MKNYLIINETHSLLPDQVRELEEKGMSDYEEIRIPKEGWNLQTRLDRAHEWARRGGRYIFVSPEPVMLGRLAYYAGHGSHYIDGTPAFGHDVAVYVFSNDRRVKKELPDGRIVQTIAPTGWKLVEIGRGDARG